MPQHANVVTLDDHRPPTVEEINSAAEALTAIANIRNPDRTLNLGGAVLSSSLVDLMVDVYRVVARGQSLSLVPLNRMLSTQEAADLLNVSRPFLIKLIDRNEVPCTMVGTHRRIALEDVLKYREQREEERIAVMEEMVDLSEDFEG